MATHACLLQILVFNNAQRRFSFYFSYSWYFGILNPFFPATTTHLARIFCHLYQDYFKIFNAVRDCGLFPEQLATDCALPWIYPEGCHVRALRRAAVHNNAHACDSNPCIVVRFLIHYDTVNLRCASSQQSSVGSHPFVCSHVQMCAFYDKKCGGKGFQCSP